jgi:hypothetical protein
MTMAMHDHSSVVRYVLAVTVTASVNAAALSLLLQTC